MKLTEEQKQELSNFLNHEKMKQLILQAQLCLLIKEVNLETLKRQVYKEAKKIRAPLSEDLKNQLEKIIRQVVDLLKYTEKECFSYVLACHLEKLAANPDVKKSEIPLECTFRDMMLKAYLNIGSNKTVVETIGLKVSKETLTLMENVDAILSCKYGTSSFIYKYAGILGMLICFLLSVFIFLNGDKIDTQLNAINVFFFLISAASAYYFKKNNSDSIINHAKDIYKQKSLFHLSLEQVDIVDAKSNEITSTTYLPLYQLEQKENKISEDKKPSTVETTDTSSPNKPNQKIKTRSSLPAVIWSLFATSTAIRWPANIVLWGNTSGTLASDQIYEMNIPFLPNTLRYYGYFNKNALLNQGLTEKDSAWQDYENRISRSKGVAPKGDSGIKKLKPAVLTDVRLAPGDNKTILFLWALKTVGTVHRLLGYEASTQLSADGTRHVLIDFGYHMARGPGH